MVKKASISLVARNEENEIIGVCFGITDFAYWLFITDLGVVREYTGIGIGKALVHKLHELAGGKDNITIVLCEVKELEQRTNLISWFKQILKIRNENEN